MKYVSKEEPRQQGKAEQAIITTNLAHRLGTGIIGTEVALRDALSSLDRMRVLSAQLKALETRYQELLNDSSRLKKIVEARIAVKEALVVGDRLAISAAQNELHRSIEEA